jgi:outer membrane protein
VSENDNKAEMKNFLKISSLVLTMLITLNTSKAQGNRFTLEDCINYALENSTDIGRATNEVKSQGSWLEQKKAARTPNLLMSGSETLSSSNSYTEASTGNSWDRDNTAYLNLALSSSLTLYNGAKLKNTILQGQTNLEAAESDIQTEKEVISLDILSAYISVMYAKELLKNDEAVLATTTKQLEQARIRKDAGVLSPVDYLNIKSQYASDKATLVESQSDLRISLVTLMQLMNMPVTDSFDIAEPVIDALLMTETETDAAVVYETALKLQPSIKTAELDLQSAEMDIQLAKADALPLVSLNANLSTLYSNSQNNVNFSGQLSHQLTPSLGVSLSIPIYQQKEIKNNVLQAKIESDNFKYNLIDIKNDLRKAIEQACSDAQSANSSYQSNLELLEAQQESYRVSEEMFAQGMVNSVDFLTSKNNLTSAETDLTRAKYTVILQKKFIEYYMGDETSLTTFSTHKNE